MTQTPPRRLLVLRLEARGCEAEAWINGIAVARVDAACQRLLVPVHEYVVEGANHIELRLWPASAGAAAGPLAPGVERLCDGAERARLQLLLADSDLPTQGNDGRALARIDWTPAAGEVCTTPLGLRRQALLPVRFPRWRWCDTPRIEDPAAVLPAVRTLLRQWSQALSGGHSAGFLVATRLRTAELSVAYGWSAGAAEGRLRAHLAALHRDGMRAWLPGPEDELVLRPVADGRLLECLGAGGACALRTRPGGDGASCSLPLRVALVGNRPQVLR